MRRRLLSDESMSVDGGVPEDAEPKVTLASAPGRGLMPGWYGDLLASVVQRVSTGRTTAVVAANRQMILTYWGIGRDILERQQAEGYGHRVIDRLSADLRERFPGVKGYSPRNLRYMRSFAEAWTDPEILQQAVAHLPWGHQIILLQRLPSIEPRLWYVQKTLENGWSRSVLDLQIDHQLYQRSGKAITNFKATLPPEDSDLAQQATKDPYLIDFVDSVDILHERQVERGLIDHIEKFLLELGQGFAFVGRQLRLTIAGDDFYLDLLFFSLHPEPLRRDRTQGRQVSARVARATRNLHGRHRRPDQKPATRADNRPAAVQGQERVAGGVRPSQSDRTDRRGGLGWSAQHQPAEGACIQPAQHRSPRSRTHRSRRGREMTTGRVMEQMESMAPRNARARDVHGS